MAAEAAIHVSNVTPIRRRLDLKSMSSAGSTAEFLLVSLVDDSDADRVEASGLHELPAPDRILGDTGLTVEEFLVRWRNGTTPLDAAARAYGRELYRFVLEQPGELCDGWQRVLSQAHEEARGIRLEIRCPIDSASEWQDQPLSALPFELMCDDKGYLFRRPGWSTVRRSRDLKSRRPRLQIGAVERARIKVAWANVQRTGCPALDETLFSAHDEAVREIAADGRVEHLPPLPAASRQELADVLEEQHPHIFVWIGHGSDSGSDLLLHDCEDDDYPNDCGKVECSSDFAKVIRAGEIDVALLWSCYGAGTFRPLDLGVAEALLHPDGGNVAAVVASYTALDAGAVAKLSHDLIQAWALGNGDLEAALARARDQLDERSLTWARPVLFLRTPLSAPGPNLFRQSPLATIPTVAQPNRLRWVPELPPQAPSYTDHHHRLTQLQQDIVRHSVVVLEGLAGIGKTELALTLAYQLRSDDQDVVFVDLSAQRSLGALRQTLGLAIREAPFDDDQQLIGALSARQWTLVLDNAEDLDENLRTDLLDLLAALCTTGPGFRAVVTTRHTLATSGGSETYGLFSRELRLLDLTESRELFVATAGPRLSNAQTETKVLDRLLGDLGGIARAVVLMAGQLGDGVDVPELHRRLVKMGTEAIVEPDLVGEALSPALDSRLSKSSLQSALRLSLNSAERQSPTAADLFHVLGTLPGGLLQFLLPREENEHLIDALSALLDHHLVHLAGEERRIMMAAPVREWARRGRLADAEDSQIVTLLDAVQRNLARYAKELQDGIESGRAHDSRLRFLAESSNLVQAISIRAAATWPPSNDVVATSLSLTLRKFADDLRSWGDRNRRTNDTFVANQAYEGALSVYRQLEDRVSEANLLQTLGELNLENDNIAEALHDYEQALRIHHKLGNAIAESNALRHVGDLRSRSGNLDGARQAFEQALPIYRRIADHLGEANTLRALGDLKVRTYDLTGALKAYGQALPIYRQIDDRLGEANTLRALGDLNVRTGDLASARQAYDQALPIFRQIDDRLGEANTLRALGDLNVRTADLASARQAYDQALPIFRQIDDRLGEANTLRALGDLNVRTADLASARQAYDQALPIFRQIDVRVGEANTLRALGDLNVRTADLASARQAYDQALPIFRQIDERLGEANTLRALGDLNVRTAKLAGALQAYDQALPIFRQIDDRLGEANTLRALGDLNVRTAKLAGALQAYDQALPIFRHIYNRLGEANTLKALGDLNVRTNDLTGALKAYDQALPIFRQIDDRLGEANTLKALGDLNVRTADLAAALKAYDQALPIYQQIDARMGEANTLQSLGVLRLATDRPDEAFAFALDAMSIRRIIGDRLGIGGTHGYFVKIAASVGGVELAIGHASQATRIFAELDDRFGQRMVLTDLGQTLLRARPAEGIACLMEAEAIAKSIGDPSATAIGSLINGLRNTDVPPTGFQAQLDQLRSEAPKILQLMFANADAAVKTGEIDLYTFPGLPEDGDDGS